VAPDDGNPVADIEVMARTERSRTQARLRIAQMVDYAGRDQPHGPAGFPQAQGIIGVVVADEQRRFR